MQSDDPKRDDLEQSERFIQIAREVEASLIDRSEVALSAIAARGKSAGVREQKPIDNKDQGRQSKS